MQNPLPGVGVISFSRFPWELRARDLTILWPRCSYTLPDPKVPESPGVAVGRFFGPSSSTPLPHPPRRQRLLLCQMASWGLEMRISGPPPPGPGLKATITWAEHAAHKDSDPQRCCIPFIPESASVSERATFLYIYILKTKNKLGANLNNLKKPRFT